MTAGPQSPSATPPAAPDADLGLLLRRIAGRDSAAFAVLYKQTHAKLYGVIARILSRGDLSGEVLQEV
jgi:RNA polymerase sigma-70 factor (ECF subfamily)